jgi:protein O-mannosyl-transferase
MLTFPRITVRHLYALILLAIVISVFGQVHNYGFIWLDDPGYVMQNPMVGAGITIDGIRWAFTTPHMAHWHPVTWLSHMTDVELFGLNPGMHHLVNLLLHAGNTLLLFFLLSRVTGEIGKSWFVAALFGVHPLHVESVAWITERKDVLSTFFGLLAILSYVRYIDRRTVAHYLYIIFFFVLSLMSKPMLVTLPFVFLLLDYWPMGRHLRGATLPGLVREKIPLFLVSFLSCIVSILAQGTGGGIVTVQQVPYVVRFGNALISYLEYAEKTFYPASLSVFYPHPWDLDSRLSPWKLGLSLALIIAVSIASYRLRKHHPYFITGWCWFLGTLVPVIGLVQVGGVAYADRFTYVPLIGVFLAAVWGTCDAVKIFRYHRPILAALGGLILLILSATAWTQTGYWRDSETLFRHSLKATPDSWVLHFNLAIVLSQQGRNAEAISQMREVLRIWPEYAKGRYILGVLLAQNGHQQEAIAEFT